MRSVSARFCKDSSLQKARRLIEQLKGKRLLSAFGRTSCSRSTSPPTRPSSAASFMDYAKDAAEEGMQKGLQERLQKGLQKGRQARDKEVIFGMLKRNLDISLISAVTGLPKAEIAKLKKALKTPL